MMHSLSFLIRTTIPGLLAVVGCLAVQTCAGQQLSPDEGASPGSATENQSQNETAAQSTNSEQALLKHVNDYLTERAAAWNTGDIDKFLKTYEGPHNIEPLNSDTDSLRARLVDRYKELVGVQPEPADDQTARPNIFSNQFVSPVESVGQLTFGDAVITNLSPQLQIISATWQLNLSQADTSGEYVVGMRKVDEDWTLSADLVTLGNKIITEKPLNNFGWASVIPPLLAIFLAIITRRVLVSLFFGIIVGCGMLAGTSGVMSFVDIWYWMIDTLNVLCETFLWPILIHTDRQRILWFVVLMGAMVGVIYRSGGMHGIVDKLTPFTKTRIGGQFVTWLLGLIIFFDDYANTLLLGNTMRPVTDRLRISREKLAYIVDSTAAPVAGLAIISTWVAMLISQVEIGFDGVNTQLAEPMEFNQFNLVVQSIPYRFYIIFAIIFVMMVALLGKDFGPMLAAEQKAADGHIPEDTQDLDDESDLPSRKWYNAVVPIVILVAFTVLFLITTGYQAALAEKKLDFDNLSWWSNFFEIFSRGDSYLALVYASLLGLLTALIFPTLQKTMSADKLFDAAWSGVKTVIPAMAILWLAWTLSELTNAEYLGTQQYLASLLTATEQPTWCPDWLFILYGNVTSVVWLPTAIFILSGFVAFATGSSWGTMGIMAPMVINVTYQLTTLQLGICPPEHPLMLAAIGSVIAGSIFGDHCSPISDTTVLSSQASSCHHIAHVRTQMPYALVVGFISILFGTLPVGYVAYQQWSVPIGWVLLVTLSLGVVSMLCILLLFGRRIKAAPH